MQKLSQKKFTPTPSQTFHSLFSFQKFFLNVFYILTLDCLYFQYAYSAFVRQLLQRRKNPVKRNYYDKEDVSARACACVRGCVRD